MKWLFVFLYWLITWLLKYVINFFELIWHLDFNHFSFYTTYFVTVKELRDVSEVAMNQGRSKEFNSIEMFIWKCLKKG